MSKNKKVTIALLIAAALIIFVPLFALKGQNLAVQMMQEA